MSFHVTKTWNNGYLCLCCHRTWETSDWHDDLEDALTEVPTDMPEVDRTFDMHLQGIKVIDGSSGEEVASGTLTWPYLGQDYTYRYKRWFGFTPEGWFDIIHQGSTPVTDRTWDEILEGLRQEKAERDLRKAQNELEETAKKLKKLGVEVDVKLEPKETP